MACAQLQPGPPFARRDDTLRAARTKAPLS
jgi:hypothetical protein